MNITTEFFLQTLKNSKYPTVMYGTGNGAEKLYGLLKQNGVVIADIFASDGFKAGKEFCNNKVLHFSQIEEKYQKFNIVLGFATDRQEVIDHIIALKERVQGRLYMPEVPVFGNGFFTKEIFEANRKQIEEVYTRLSDSTSEKVFESIINFKLSGNIDYLLNTQTDKAEIYNLLNIKNAKIFADCGAYNGDTVQEFVGFNKNYTNIYAVEPAPKNFIKLKENTKFLKNITCFNCAVGSKESVGSLSSKSGRSPYLLNNGKVRTKIMPLDNLIKNADFIKYDVEGNEYNALLGSKSLLEKYPVLQISAYHKMLDFITIPLYILKHYPQYKIYLRHHRYLPSWETNYYFKK